LGPGIARDRIALNGQGKSLSAEILLEECDASEKKAVAELSEEEEAPSS
jgi:hypothetical protein